LRIAQRPYRYPVYLLGRFSRVTRAEPTD